MTTNGRTRWIAAALTLLATWAGGLVAGIWCASADRAQALGQIQQNSQGLADHEARLRIVEDTSARIATDVGWIRKRMEAGY